MGGNRSPDFVMPQNVVFESFRFEPATGRLWSTADEVRLTPKAAAVLATLVAHAGELVAKQTLFESVWGGTIVNEDSLISCVQELRKALGDDPKHPRFIETRYCRGYRFISSIERAAMDTDASPAA